MSFNPIEPTDGCLQGNTSLVTPELTQAIEQSIKPIMVQGYRRGQTFLAVGCQHGKRLMLQINVHATEIPTLLRSRSVNIDDGKNNPNSGKNRPINLDHVKAIKNYIIERANSGNKWVLGTITANIDPNKLEYQKIWGDLYVVFIPNSTFLEITDGQHRKRAITEIIESDGYERDLIADATFPVNLVLEGNQDQCQTDFSDMAKTYPIADSLLVAYASFGRNGVAKDVAEKVNLFRYKTEKIKSTPGSRSGYIYTLNYIAKLVSCAFAGNTSDELVHFKTDEVVIKQANILSECLNYFFAAYSLTRSLAKEEKLRWQDATKFRNTNILGISAGLEILGLLLHHTYDKDKNDFDLGKVKQIANQIDWLKGGECWKDTIIVPNGKGAFKIIASRGSVSTALEKCMKQLGWRI